MQGAHRHDWSFGVAQRAESPSRVSSSSAAPYVCVHTVQRRWVCSSVAWQATRSAQLRRATRAHRARRTSRTVGRLLAVVRRVQRPQQVQLLRGGGVHPQLAQRQGIPGRPGQQVLAGAVLPEVLQALQDGAPRALQQTVNQGASDMRHTSNYEVFGKSHSSSVQHTCASTEPAT
jgi:hypothetical protein